MSSSALRIVADPNDNDCQLASSPERKPVLELTRSITSVACSLVAAWAFDAVRR
jgi:hypothetical protein